AYSDRKKEGLVGFVKTLREMDTPKKAGSTVPLSATLITTSLSTYDFDGKLIEWTVFDASSGSFALKYQYKYDDSGIINSTTIVDSSGKVETLAYDLDGGVR